MEKMTGIYLTEKDRKKLETIKKIRETTKNTDAIRLLIKEEYERILTYKGVI